MPFRNDIDAAVAARDAAKQELEDERKRSSRLDGTIEDQRSEINGLRSALRRENNTRRMRIISWVSAASVWLLFLFGLGVKVQQCACTPDPLVEHEVELGESFGGQLNLENTWWVLDLPEPRQLSFLVSGTKLDYIDVLIYIQSSRFPVEKFSLSRSASERTERNKGVYDIPQGEIYTSQVAFPAGKVKLRFRGRDVPDCESDGTFICIVRLPMTGSSSGEESHQ